MYGCSPSALVRGTRCANDAAMFLADASGRADIGLIALTQSGVNTVIPGHALRLAAIAGHAVPYCLDALTAAKTHPTSSRSNISVISASHNRNAA